MSHKSEACKHILSIQQSLLWHIIMFSLLTGHTMNSWQKKKVKNIYLLLDQKDSLCLEWLQTGWKYMKIWK